MHFVAARLTAYIVALIVGVTVIAGLIVGAQRADDGPVDVMVVNGRVYTADGEGTTAEAVAIQGNKILRVGSTREIQRLRRAQTVVIDARGGAVLPGFVQTDAHLFAADDAAAESSDAPDGSRPPEREADLAALHESMIEAHRRGITSVQPAAASPYELELYDELRRQDLLRLRIYSTLAVSPQTSEAELAALDRLRARFPDDPLLKAGAAEIAVEEDDVAGGTLSALVAALDARDWQIVLRATSDRALGAAFAAYAHAIAVNPEPARGRRHRIEVEGIVGPVDFEPFEALGILYTPSDAPISALDAIDAHTRHAAWASFDEQRKGSLVRDMLADLVVLTRDITSLSSGRLSDAEVSVTIFDGKGVFQRTADSDN
jgi:predicted amidohydrolase YtcJ